ncbi:hypothetical protein [Yoonia sp. R2-816]|uniref:hypothetical protein n=1 Tax=Yoonia sp. R2-816 TaxID=3342638 RepID=UPI0037299916
MFWVFKKAKSDIHAAMMAAAGKGDCPRKRLRSMWFALVEYGFAAPNDFIFVEMMTAEIHKAFEGDPELEQIQTDVLSEIQAGIESNVLVQAPTETIEIILASPAITLARRASGTGVRMDRAELERVFELVWRGISRSPVE